MKIIYEGLELIPDKFQELDILRILLGTLVKEKVDLKPGKKPVKKAKRTNRRFNSSKKWSDTEKHNLKKEWLSGIRASEIAKIHGRPVGGVKFMARELKLPRRVNALLPKRDFLKTTMPNGIVVDSTPLIK